MPRKLKEELKHLLHNLVVSTNVRNDVKSAIAELNRLDKIDKPPLAGFIFLLIKWEPKIILNEHNQQLIKVFLAKNEAFSTVSDPELVKFKEYFEEFGLIEQHERKIKHSIR